MGSFLRVATCLCMASLAWGHRSRGFLADMDRREAAKLTVQQFKLDYVTSGRPVIIRNDPSALALSYALTLDAVLSMCGDKRPRMDNHFVDVIKWGIKWGISPEMTKAVTERLNYTDGVNFEDAIAELTGLGTTKTLSDYIEGPFFKNPVKTAQDPRFPGSLKDWSHPADYMWPPSVYGWQMGHCPVLVMRVRQLLGADVDGYTTEGITGIPYVRALMTDEEKHRRHRPAGHMMCMYASGDKVRGAPPHVHRHPNHSVMLVLRGTKRIVTWPSQQRERLYPIEFGEVGMLNDHFMANAFDVNLTAQPDLRDAIGGLQGEAGVGDLIYLPCGAVHAFESVGSTMALAWRRVEAVECPTRT